MFFFYIYLCKICLTIFRQANIEDEISTEDAEDFSAKNIFYHSVSKWFSPSNSFIQIFYEGTSPLKCKSWQTFNLLFTLNSTRINGTKNDPIEFNYLVSLVKICMH